MAVKNYQWGAALTIESGGFDGEEITISDGVQTKTFTNHVSDPKPYTFWFDERTSTSETGSATYTYTYQDLDGAKTTGYYSQVSITVMDSWTVSIDTVTNKMRVTINSTLLSGSRTPIRNPSASRDWRWWQIVKRSAAGVVLTDGIDTANATPHTINFLTNVPLGQYTYEILPGRESSQSSIWYRNVYYGYTEGGAWAPDLPWPNIYTDIFGIGIHFKNILPPPTTYTLTYNANGGTGAPLPQTASTAEGSYTFTVSNGTPTWGSYIFLGWSNSPVSGSGTMADVDYQAGDTITIQEGSPSKTIYAVWEKDYRPGKILDNNLTWQSHNRSTGADNIRTASSWQTMRTQDGGVASDNPPTIAHSSSSFKNMRKIGANS